jgi:predicted HicB family RNase H-like nuclease
VNNLFEYKGYHGSVEFSTPDNVLHGEVLGIDGLISYEGNTLDELRTDFEESIDDYLEMCEEKGFEPQKPFTDKIKIHVSPELHRNIAIYSLMHNKPLDYIVEEALKSYLQQTVS